MKYLNTFLFTKKTIKIKLSALYDENSCLLKGVANCGSEIKYENGSKYVVNVYRNYQSILTLSCTI